jgi:hypothetical protein
LDENHVLHVRDSPRLAAPRSASHAAVQANGDVTVVPPPAGQAAQADFIPLRDEGDATELRASQWRHPNPIR